ncbi:hypothetical protein [Desulfallas thermosapovorans]|uniref:Uncharacterized protein n=1 Tax=Desulfallas thermosapovorans DSM 6562 TaxID=1121431 RepID=A0A5S4ZPB8_9FIRM|nr:hypothetical protein [Desulfallas thermosapovorans]TYO94631.1 hypothetical protein LX24_02289 [Desulfallas thermosapovorans DSM 6562]
MILVALLINLLVLLLIIISLVAFSKVRISLGKTRLVVGFYMVILFVSVPVYYAIAEPGTPEPVEIVEIGPGQYSYQDSRINAFYDAFYEGRLNDYEGAEIIARWSFDYQGERLKITAPDYERYSIPINVERKDVCDSKLEVFSYVPKLPNRLTLANPPDIRLQDNQLEILQPEKIHHEAARFYHDFTMAQFTGRGYSMDRMGMDYSSSDMVIYLQIPEDLLIDTDDSTEHKIHFLNE